MKVCCLPLLLMDAMAMGVHLIMACCVLSEALSGVCFPLVVYVNINNTDFPLPSPTPLRPT